jgi:hypothetical protein
MTIRRPTETPEILNNLPNENQVSMDRKTIYKWYPYFLINGSPREKEAKGSFELSDCPTQEEVTMAILESKLHPAGKYQVEKRKSGQMPKEIFYFEKPSSSFFQQNNKQQIIDVESDENETDDEHDSMPILIQSLISSFQQQITELKQGIREQRESLQNSEESSEQVALIRELNRQNEKAIERSEKANERMFQMLLAQQSNQVQQPNPANLMLEMLHSTLAVQKGVKELSEEISPQETSSNGSFLGDAAKLMDSIGKNVPAFLPMIMGNRPRIPLVRPQNTAPPTANGNGANGSNSNLAETFAKINKTENK